MLQPIEHSSPPSPHILIADVDLCLPQSMSPYLQKSFPRCTIDLCSSHEKALQKLLAEPYQLIISGMHMAEIKDFLLVEQTKLAQPLTPVVVTATTTHTASALEALRRGAFDFILKPLDTKEVDTCLRLVRQYHELRHLLALERRARETYHHALTLAQTNQAHPMYERFMKLTTTYRTSIQRVAENICVIKDMMQDVRTKANARANERLKLLGEKKNEQITRSVEPENPKLCPMCQSPMLPHAHRRNDKDVIAETWWCNPCNEVWPLSERT